MAEPAAGPTGPVAGATPGARRSYGPVLLLGLLAGTVGAVAGNKPWAQASGERASQFSELAISADAAEMPVAAALALVVLACWGVVLVSRGWVRRGVTALGALAAGGTLASVLIGFSSVPDALRASFAELGGTEVDISRTGWFWLAAVAATLSVVATLLAVRLVPVWPEMGTRYDAPGAATSSQDGPPDVAPEEQSSLDLWKAMDEGRDPTA